MDNFLDGLTLEGAGGQTDDTRSTLKTLGHDIGKVGSIKSEGTRARYFFLGTGNEIREKRNLFVNRSVHEIFQWEFFWGVSTHGIPVHSGFRKYI